MQNIFSVKKLSFNQTGSKNIRSGEKLQIKVVEKTSNYSKILAKSNYFLVRNLKFPVGYKLNVQALWKGNILNFIVLKETHLNNSFKTNILNNNELTQLILLESKLAGLSLNKENVETLKSIFKNKSKISKEKIRLAIEALKKGLPPENFINILDFTSEKKNKDQDEKLLLFNHFKSNDDIWYLMPIEFDNQYNESLKGSLRIKKNINKNKITKVIIETIIDNSSIYFIIKDFHKKTRKMQIYHEPDINSNLLKEMYKKLPKILSNLGIHIDDNNNVDSFDGFSFGKNNIGVDTFV